MVSANHHHYHTGNYREQGGERWVIGGELEFLPGSVIIGADLAGSTPSATYDDTALVARVAALEAALGLVPPVVKPQRSLVPAASYVHALTSGNDVPKPPGVDPILRVLFAPSPGNGGSPLGNSVGANLVMVYEYAPTYSGAEATWTLSFDVPNGHRSAKLSDFVILYDTEHEIGKLYHSDGTLIAEVKATANIQCDVPSLIAPYRFRPSSQNVSPGDGFSTYATVMVEPASDYTAPVLTTVTETSGRSVLHNWLWNFGELTYVNATEVLAKSVPDMNLQFALIECGDYNVENIQSSAGTFGNGPYDGSPSPVTWTSISEG